MARTFAITLALIPLATSAVGCNEPVQRGVQVTNRFPHDRSAYTQGLVFHDGLLYEGTGLVGESRIRAVELTSGRVIRETKLHGQHFGEGIAMVGDRIYQLTWQSGIAFIYDRSTLTLVDSVRYAGEGWGLTWSGTHFVMSNGSDSLQFRDPDFRVVHSLKVRDRGVPVSRLNELEWVDGEVYANVYQDSQIARIDPATGEVVGWIDLLGVLRPGEQLGIDVLNGIAWDASLRRLFITWKLWPVILEIVTQSK